MLLTIEISFNLDNIVYKEHNISLLCNTRLVNDNLDVVFIDAFKEHLNSFYEMPGFGGIEFNIKLDGNSSSKLKIICRTYEMSITLSELYNKLKYIINTSAEEASAKTDIGLCYNRCNEIDVMHMSMYTSDDVLFL